MIRFIFLLFCVHLSFSQEIELNIYDANVNKKNKILKSSLKIKESRYTVVKDSLINSYVESGYFSLKEDSIITNLKSKNIYINFGNKYKYIKIAKPKNFNLINKIEKISNSKFLNNYIKIDVKDIKEFILSLKESFIADGFSFVTVSLIDFTIITPTTITVNIKIDKRNIRKTDKIIVKGYEKMPKSFLKRKILNKTEKVFSNETLNQISDNLDKISFIKQIKKPEALFLKDSTIIYTYIEKLKKSYFDGLIGFSAGESNNTFNGYLNLYLQNVFDYGESLMVRWNKNVNEGQDLEIAINTPYIFKTPLEIDFNTQLRKRDSTFLQLNLNLGLNLELKNDHKVGLIYSIVDNSSLSNTDDETENINFNSKFYGIRYNYIKHSKNIYTNENIYFLVESSFGNRVSSKEKESQIKINSKIFKNWNLINKHFLVTKFIAAKLFSDEYLPNEVYIIGGDDSVRGVLQNSLFVTSYNIFSFEYRFYQSVENYFYSFTDLGNMYNNKQSTNLLSIGVGYSFRVKAGSINLNYAINKLEGTPMSKGVLSVSFKTYF